MRIRSVWMKLLGVVCTTLSLVTTGIAEETRQISLNYKLVLYSSFDSVCDLNLSGGDGWICTADSIARENVRVGNFRSDAEIVPGAGRYGDALRFKSVSKQVLFYKGEEFEYREQDWDGTVSFWLKLDPNKDLEPGYCDPLQVTDKKWNDAAMFVDFDKDLPRDFRLGVFSDFDHWNPKKTAWEKVPADKRPLVTVHEPPFSGDDWTHVVYTFKDINSSQGLDATCALYLNGELQGTIKRPMKFSWDRSRVAMMIGINYIGDFDELAVWERALTDEDVKRLYRQPGGIHGIGHGD